MGKKVLLCFMDDITDINALDVFLKQFEAAGIEVHVFDHINEHAVQPHHIPVLIDNVFGADSIHCEFIFMSNLVDLFLPVYRLYRQLYNHFVFYSIQSSNCKYTMDSIYTALMEKPIGDLERIEKPFYTYGSGIVDKHFIRQGALCIPFSSVSELIQDYEATMPNIRRVYFDGSRYHIFEAVDAESVMIHLTEGMTSLQPTFEGTDFHMDLQELEEIRSVVDHLENNPNYFVVEFQYIRNVFQEAQSTMSEKSYFITNSFIAAVHMMAASKSMMTKIFLLSFLMKFTRKSAYLNEIFQISTSDRLTLKQKYFIQWQCAQSIFMKAVQVDKTSASLNWQLYRHIVNRHKELFVKEDLAFIPKEERNQEMVFVFTGQLLGLNHGPTKTAMDRCHHLQRLGKKVLLINTKEVLSNAELIPYYLIKEGNVSQDYNDKNSILYKDNEIAFYQCQGEMPDVAEIKNIIDVIRKHKPFLMFSIGGYNLTADICSNIIPLANINTVNSQLSVSESQFHIIGRSVDDEEKELLREFSFSENNIIESIFTFDFRKQENRYTREQLGLPLNKRLLVVIGARLSDEVNEKLADALMLTTRYGTHIVFVGEFEKYTEFADRVPRLKENSVFLGLQQDMLAILECCDIYVNPKRTGGATSAVEAMYKGLPVVTFSSGDVFVAAGEEFAVDSYRSMQERIIKLVQHKDYYLTSSKLAQEKARVLMDTKAEMKRIMEKIIASPLF